MSAAMVVGGTVVGISLLVRSREPSVLTVAVASVLLVDAILAAAVGLLMGRRWLYMGRVITAAQKGCAKQLLVGLHHLAQLEAAYSRWGFVGWGANDALHSVADACASCQLPDSAAVEGAVRAASFPEGVLILRREGRVQAERELKHLVGQTEYAMAILDGARV
jgi:hypothetical protein